MVFSCAVGAHIYHVCMVGAEVGGGCTAEVESEQRRVLDVLLLDVQYKYLLCSSHVKPDLSPCVRAFAVARAGSTRAREPLSPLPS